MEKTGNGCTDGPKAPRDPDMKRKGFYIMRGKQIAGSIQPDGRGIQFLYLDGGRLESFARIEGNVTDERIIELLHTAAGFRKLVHSIGVTVEMTKGMGKTADFVFQMYGRRDAGISATEIRESIPADGMERMVELENYRWSEADRAPGQMRFEFPVSGEQAAVWVKLYLQEGFEAPEESEDETVDLESADYHKMLEKSILQTGNPARLRKALSRARLGEDVTIAFIGGSITQGAGAVPINTECYAYKTFKSFCALAGRGTEENVHYIKAGVGGTSSELGMLRYERDVLRDGSVEPDIVIVEFAVNDEGDETKGECYDSLVRKILSAANRPAVVLLFAVFADDWNLQERLKPVGVSYDLPMVSVRDAVVGQFYKKPGAGRVFSKHQFFYDCYHPANLGHRVMADCIANLFRTVQTMPEGRDSLQLEETEPPLGGEFEAVRMFDRKSVPEDILVDQGSFCHRDEDLQAVEMDSNLVTTKEFPDNWMHREGDFPFSMDITCSALLLVYKDSGSCSVGSAEVLVDGEKALTADPHVNGWIHCNSVICFRGRKQKRYHVEIHMASGDEDKEFTILGFGYVKGVLIAEDGLMKIELKRDHMPPILVEREAYEGVRRVAGKMAEDIRKVTGTLPKVVTEEELSAAGASQVILCAALGKSRILDALAERKLADTEGLRKDGKEPRWEVWQIRMISLKHHIGDDGMGIAALPECVKEILLICGSDKRGTIYGMFSLSEYIGVSPLCYWGDAEPVRREVLSIGKDIETLSREPSVKYRGFFINDEWPCFGRWVTEHFGDFNAEAYDHVFELLLRLKGNYLWPAMWSASFPLDGPGSKNEELAELYGVVIGYSHHEPCLRASEEWDKVRGEKSPYGNEWNFYTNEQGLLRYWEDALKRSGKYENMITVGMRGERDSSMLGKDATLRENIELLKNIIRKQRALIDLHVKRESGSVPLMLALYKEVEPYFYGDRHTPGLKDWGGLKGVTCMLCEDNYGYMRTLPTEDIRGREGGFGMYYHLDYHGGPVSYEWVDSTPLSQIWEQMSEAYEYGVRDIWIVNVGDLKFHEVPLSYFMALAYDYEKWGYGNQESCTEYTKDWVSRTFPGEDPECREKIGKVLTDYIRLNSLRRPEALHAGIYHPCHYEETDRMLKQVREVESLSGQVMGELRDRQAYYSMIHYPAMASMNLLRMHLYAGKNRHYAVQNRKAANHYADLVQECIRTDREFSEEWAAFRGGKWNGMQQAQHIGFTGWCEEGYRYPVIMRVEPVHCPRLSVSRKDEERTSAGASSSFSGITVPDFQYAGCSRVVLEIANEGRGSLYYRIAAAGTAEEAEGKPAEAILPRWLTVSPMEGEVEMLQEIELLCDRAKLPEKTEKVKLRIESDAGKAEVGICARAARRRGGAVADLPEMTFLGRGNIIVIYAEHYCRKKDTNKGEFRILKDYGKHGSGVRVFPCTAAFGEEDDKPELVYRFLAEEAGAYEVELMTAPANPLIYGQSVHFLVSGSEGETVKAELVPKDFRAGDCDDSRWSGPALDKERKTRVRLHFGEGVQEVVIGAMEAGTVLEKIMICKAGTYVPESYLGPEESCFV